MGDFVLTCFWENRALHFKINRSAAEQKNSTSSHVFHFEDENFRSVPELIEFYRTHAKPITEQSGAKILTPLNRTHPLSFYDQLSRKWKKGAEIFSSTYESMKTLKNSIPRMQSAPVMLHRPLPEIPKQPEKPRRAPSLRFSERPMIFVRNRQGEFKEISQDDDGANDYSEIDYSELNDEIPPALPDRSASGSSLNYSRGSRDSRGSRGSMIPEPNDEIPPALPDRSVSGSSLNYSRGFRGFTIPERDSAVQLDFFADYDHPSQISRPVLKLPSILDVDVRSFSSRLLSDENKPLQCPFVPALLLNSGVEELALALQISDFQFFRRLFSTPSGNDQENLPFQSSRLNLGLLLQPFAQNRRLDALER